MKKAAKAAFFIPDPAALFYSRIKLTSFIALEHILKIDHLDP